MSEVERALSQLREIHAHLDRGQVFRGWRWMTVAATGLIGLGAAALQESWLRPTALPAYLGFWIGVAFLGGGLCAADLLLHLRRHGRISVRRQAGTAVLPFLPAIAVGAAAAYVLWNRPEAALLPGLWSIAFGLGLSAVRPYLPRGTTGVAAWFLAAGVFALAGATSGVVPSPWTMGGSFGVGLLLLALALQIDLARVSAGERR
ncbi:MAG: hypothetical protein R3F20_17845 [Planctomycetota bacterium]